MYRKQYVFRENTIFLLPSFPLFLPPSSQFYSKETGIELPNIQITFSYFI